MMGIYKVVRRLASFLLLILIAASDSLISKSPSANSVTVTTVPAASVTGIVPVTFGLPFNKGEIAESALSTVRVLQKGTELPSNVSVIARWADGSIRVVRIQFSTGTFGSLTVEWGGSQRLEASLVNPRNGWQVASAGSFMATDGIYEPKVLVLVPRERLAYLRLLPINPMSVPDEREDPTTVFSANYPDFEDIDHAEHNQLFSLVNEDDTRVTIDNQCPYKTDYEPWLYDRAAAIFATYFRSGKTKHLQEGIRAAEFYRIKIYTEGNLKGMFALKNPNPNESYGDLKYSYLESLTYLRWLTGDDTVLPYYPLIADAWAQGGMNRWTPTTNFWTERHLGMEMLANVIGFEATGESRYKQRVETMLDDLLWHLNGAGGQLPANRIDGGLYHYGFQHDWDWKDNTLAASPWMSTLVMEAAFRYNAYSGDARAAEIVRRMGTLLVASIKLRKDVNYEVDSPIPVPDYAVSPDGTTATAEWGDEEHALDVATGLAMAASHGNDAARGTSSILYQQTYRVGFKYWVRPGGPSSGKTAYRVSPWRKYGWEHRFGGSLAALLKHAVASLQLELTAVRKTARSLLIQRSYGDLTFTIGNSGGIAVAKYVIYRKSGSGSFETLTELPAGASTYSHQDKYLSSNVSYTYRIAALNGAGKVCGTSADKTI